MVLGANNSAGVTLTNVGGSDLHISSLAVSGGTGFSLNSNETCPLMGTVSPGSICFIGVTFAPTTTGPETGMVSITDDAFDKTQTVVLTGTGINSTDPAPDPLARRGVLPPLSRFPTGRQLRMQVQSRLGRG